MIVTDDQLLIDMDYFLTPFVRLVVIGKK